MRPQTPENRTGPAESSTTIVPEKELPPCSLTRKLLILFFCLTLLALGIAGSLALFHSRPIVQRKSPPPFIPHVQVRPLQATTCRPVIKVMGTVEPARWIRLRPAVSGTVQMVAPVLRPGGLLRKGDVVLRLDAREYRLAVEKSRQNLEKTRMDLRLEEGRQVVARREFELMQAGRKENLDQKQRDLVLRQPQLARARAMEAAARAELEQAQLRLEKTVLRAPYDALVRSREVSEGSQVTPQSVVAELVAIDYFWVQASVARRLLALCRLPQGKTPGATVSVRPLPDDGGSQWSGQIIGLYPDVESRGLMARLLIRVDRPVQEEQRLLLGSRVAVHIRGIRLEHCFRLESRFVRADDTVLLASPDNRLEIRALEPVFRDRHWVYVQEGLAEGEQLIVSPLAAPVAGMALRPGRADDRARQAGP